MTATTISRLLPEDTEYLDSLGLKYEVSVEKAMTCIVLFDWQLPAGLNYPTVDLLLRLSDGYPDVAPDMWWVSPVIGRADNVEIPAVQHMEDHLGRKWQRWSRHLPAGVWKSGIDRLETYAALIVREFKKAGDGGG